MDGEEEYEGFSMQQDMSFNDVEQYEGEEAIDLDEEVDYSSMTDLDNSEAVYVQEGELNEQHYVDEDNTNMIKSARDEQDVEHENALEMDVLESIDPLDDLDELEDLDDEYEDSNVALVHQSIEKLKVKDAADNYDEELKLMQRNISQGVPPNHQQINSSQNISNSDPSEGTLMTQSDVHEDDSITKKKKRAKQAHSKSKSFEEFRNSIQDFASIEKELALNESIEEELRIEEEDTEKKTKVKPRRKPESNSREEDLQTIEKLKQTNQALKNQLLELNAALDRQLAQKGVLIGKPRKASSTNEQEVKVLMQQIAILKKTNEDLKAKLATSTDLDRITFLENKLQARANKIQKLQEENKSLRNVEREQSKALENYNSDHEKVINQQKSEIHYHKEKIKKLKEAFEKAKIIVEQKSKLLEATETKYRNLEDVMKQANLTKGGIIESKKLEQELEAKTKQLENLEKKLGIEMNSKESMKKQASLQLGQLKQTIQKQEVAIEDLKAQLDEKDKQLRGALLQMKNSAPSKNTKAISSPSNKPSVEPNRPAVPRSIPKNDSKPSTKSTAPKIESKPTRAPAVQKAIAQKSKLPIMKKRLPQVDSRETEDEKNPITSMNNDSGDSVKQDKTDDEDRFDSDFETDFDQEVQEIEEEGTNQQTSVFAPDF